MILTIENIVYHCLLSCYAKSLFDIYINEIKQDAELLNSRNLSMQNVTFVSLQRKISKRITKIGVSITEQIPSVVIRDAIKDNKKNTKKFIYPVKIELNTDEEFWFEYLINKSVDQVRKILLKGDMDGKILFEHGILSNFKGFKNANEIRKKFIKDCKIDNKPERLKAKSKHR